MKFIKEILKFFPAIATMNFLNGTNNRTENDGEKRTKSLPSRDEASLKGGIT